MKIDIQQVNLAIDDTTDDDVLRARIKQHAATLVSLQGMTTDTAISILNETILEMEILRDILLAQPK